MKDIQEVKESTDAKLKEIEQSANEELEKLRELYVNEYSARVDLEEKHENLKTQLIKIEMSRSTSDKQGRHLSIFASLRVIRFPQYNKIRKMNHLRKQMK